MNHAVEKYFQQARELAANTYVPPKSAHSSSRTSA